MKGEFGMRLDSSFYNKYVELFDSYMCKIFGTDIEKTEAICSFENRGFFRLEYKYYPHNYRIVIENDEQVLKSMQLVDDYSYYESSNVRAYLKTGTPNNK